MMFSPFRMFFCAYMCFTVFSQWFAARAPEQRDGTCSCVVVVARARQNIGISH